MGSVLRFFLLTLLLQSSLLQAGEIEGRLNGLGCATAGKLCPTDRKDPHLMLERDFVLQRPDGSYFFITNIDWRTKMQNVLRFVRVKGEFNERRSAIAADELWAKEDDGYRLIWSLDQHRGKEPAPHPAGE